MTMPERTIAMLAWDMYKKAFFAWENATAKVLEAWLRSPLVLGPSGAMLTATMRAKAQGDKAVALFWGSMGLPTKRDQERILHALNQLESRLIDLDEKLDDERKKGG
jgi:hypothetical protein